MRIFKSNLSNKNFLSSGGEYAREYLSQLDGEYEMYKDSPIEELSFSSFKEYFVSGNRLAYENEYFHRRAILRDFALKAWLGGDGALIRLENVMRAVCNERTWALPAHLGGDMFADTIDLFAAETAQTLAEILSLLHGKISEEIEERCIGEVKRRVLNPFVNRKNPYAWESMESNWCAVCGGCVGMTALYLIEDDNDLKSVTDSLKPTFDSYILSFAADGACLEGLYYWNYGMMYFTAFLDLYRQRFGEDYPADFDMLKKMADFGHKCCISDGITISFSDGYERDKLYAGLSCYLNRTCGAGAAGIGYIARFSGDECGRWCKAVRDIAWTDTSVFKEEKENAVLPEAQWALLRGGEMSVVLKGGNNGEPHNHNDVGNIIAVKNGSVILCDIGAGEYTSEYFSEDRYDIFCTRSMGHSVPLINGGEQKTGGIYRASGFFADGNEARADISGAYGNDALRKCARQVKCASNEILLSDKFVLDKRTEITERFITRHKAFAENNEVKIMRDGNIIGRLITENVCDIEIKTYEHREHNGGVSLITAVDFSFTANDVYNFSLKIF
ncbi:MAG: heparinase II/III family protein [Firmicutes bacterium]|nr:heparinase II/III family protein [Bacillota bacterium]